MSVVDSSVEHPFAALDRFLNAESEEEALAIFAEESQQLLNEASLNELARRRQAAVEPAQRQRMEESSQLLLALREFQAELERRSPHERLLLAFESTRSSQDIFALILNTPDEALDALEEEVEARLSTTEGNAAEAIRQRLAVLRRLRGEGRETLIQAAAAMQAGMDMTQALADQLVEWIRTPDWDASERYLQQHAADLLTDAGESALALLQQANPDNNDIPLHQKLLRHCRADGIAAAYAQLRQERQSAQTLNQNPLLQQVIAFLRADDVDASALLTADGSLLQSVDARALLEQFLQAARDQGDAAAAALIQARLNLWGERWRASQPAPRRPQPDADWQEQPQSRRLDLPAHEALSAQPGLRYVVVNNRGAVGDYAQVVNLYNLDLPLRWKAPDETRATLARSAVGRETELGELHRRLSTGDGAALVSQGTAAAVRGQPGIGKTVLAAMYATRYQDRYPGGVLWLEVGPSLRSRQSVTPLLQQMARYAYDANLAADLLDTVVFAPEAVAALLSGHGPMLIVIDDAWSEEVVAELKAAAPADASILLTTRDYDVAFALEERDDAIQRLDVLSAADARLLIHSKVPHLDSSLADALAQGLGRHAQALTLAAGALNRRGRNRYAHTVAEILEAVRLGRNFGDLPRMDKAERVNAVEVALRYSYDYLGEGKGGAECQACLRALGSLAQEADFDTGVGAALWSLDMAAAREMLLLFDGLALIQERLPAHAARWAEERWQQHAILRAYSLSLQGEEEGLHWAIAHADYYGALAEAAYRSKPRDYDRMEREFAQIAHAYQWCGRHSTLRLLRLRDALNDFMLVRGRAVQLGQWSQAALSLADQIGDRGRKANTLKSLGDLESRLGNIDAARTHYDNALPLYKEEQARLGTANTLKSLGDLERRLGNIDAARTHYDNALPLYEAEQNPVGKMNVRIGQARLAAGQGDLNLARGYFAQVFELADSIGFGNHPVTQNLRQEYAAISQLADNQPDEKVAARLKALETTLLAWIGTASWDESEAYLVDHQNDLLTDEAIAILMTMVRLNPQNAMLMQHLALLHRSREIGVANAYRELRRVDDDPVQPALAALFNAASYAELRQAITDHPLLLALPTLERLASTAEEVHAAGRAEALQGLMALLLFLFDAYNRAHVEGIDPNQQQRFIAIHQRLLPLAGELVADLRRSAAWAFNTLGNHFANDKRDLAQAVAAYTAGVDMNETDAMILRNRAGVFIDLDDYAAAAADIDAAAVIEPDAARLPSLRCLLYAGLGNADALLAVAVPHQATHPDSADAHLYLAVGHLLRGEMDRATEAIHTSARLAAPKERQEGIDWLQRLARRHPIFAPSLQEMATILQGETHG